jgi:hypothetical protein
MTEGLVDIIHTDFDRFLTFLESNQTDFQRLWGDP